MTTPAQDTTETNSGTVLAFASIASFMVALDSLVVSTALSTLQTTLHASLESLQWVVNAYGLALAALLITGAALGDRFGRRRMFATGLVLFTLSSITCALSNSIAMLVASRAVQGAAAALVLPLAMALLTAAFPPERRGRALGIFGSITGLAVLGGPVIGGMIVEGLAWQWVFWLNVPIGVALVPLVLRHVPESFGADAKFDLVGVALISTGALGVAWGLMRGNHAGWMSREVIAMLAAGAVLMIGFILWGMRAKAPMVPMRLFRSRAFAAGNAASVCLFATLYSAVFFVAQFLQVGQGYSPLGAGLRVLPWTATLFFVAPIAGNLIRKTGERPLIVVGLFLQAAGLGWLAMLARPDLPFVQMIAPLVIAGCGVSMAMPAAQSVVLGSVAKSDIGKASGVYNMLRFLGGVFGIAVLGAVFASAGAITSAAAFNSGFEAAILGCALFSFAGALAGTALPGRAAVAAAAPIKA